MAFVTVLMEFLAVGSMIGTGFAALIFATGFVGFIRIMPWPALAEVDQ